LPEVPSENFGKIDSGKADIINSILCRSNSKKDFQKQFLLEAEKIVIENNNTDLSDRLYKLIKAKENALIANNLANS